MCGGREMVMPANNSDEVAEVGIHTAEVNVVLQHVLLLFSL